MRRLFLTGAGIWTLIDQGLVSLGGVATSIVLARGLRPSDFGTFVLLFGAMLVLNTVHASLIIYPLSVRGARLSRRALRTMTGGFLLLTLLLAVPLAAVLTGAAGVIGAVQLAPWVIAAMLAWQWQETIRRALFAELRHRSAILGDIVAYLGQAALIAALDESGHLSLRGVFVAIAATSLLGAALQMVIVRPRRMERPRCVALATAAIREGRWVLPANILGSVIMQALVWTLALAESPTGAADLQAVISVVGVANPVMFGVANLVLPLVARDRQRTPLARVRRRLGTVIAQGGALLLPYSLVLWLWPGRVLTLIYGPTSPYVALANPLRLLGVAYLLVYLVHVGNAALFGVEHTRAVLAVQVVGVLALALCGVPLAYVWGVTGAAVATIAVHGIRAVVCSYATRDAFTLREGTPFSLAETA